MSNEILTYLHDGIELTGEDWTNSTHSFGDLVHVIGSTHDAAQTAAVKAINRMQTMRNPTRCCRGQNNRAVFPMNCRSVRHSLEEFLVKQLGYEFDTI